MLIAILVIVGIYLFSKSSSIVTPANSAGNYGGTSTPKPSATTPPFYQQSNAATGNRPITTQSFNPVDLHNNIIVATKLPILSSSFGGNGVTPTVPNDISYTEQTSNGQEQAVSYANNGIKIPFSRSYDPTLSKPPFIDEMVHLAPTWGTPVIAKPPAAPITVATAASYQGLAIGSAPPEQLAMYQSDAASIAPNPLPNPTFEKTVPVIASKVINNSLAPEPVYSGISTRASAFTPALV